MYRLCCLAVTMDTMKITVNPGTYVAAVSGGVDSMVLLDLLHILPNVHIIVAHLDHGIRKDSSEDRMLVEAAARVYNMPFEYREVWLGAGASEAEARRVRYAFLEAVCRQYDAQAIIMAHHQDDVIETALINVLRGTGRKGLSSLQSSDTVLRPLLHVPKQEIREYAEAHKIYWREDSTNQDERYLRNFIRRQLLPQLGAAQKQQFFERLLQTADVNQRLDNLLADSLRTHIDNDGLDRQWFIGLPYDVSAELIATWLREGGIRDFDRKAVERLVVAAKTALPGKQVDAIAGAKLQIGRRRLLLVMR